MILFDPKNPDFFYKLGFAYLNTPHKADSALICFKKAQHLLSPKSQVSFNKPSLDFYRAYAYFLTHNIDSCARILQTYQKNKHQYPQYFNNTINSLLDSVNQIATQFFLIQNLGPNINSKYTEHSPIFDKDSKMLLFTSRRKLGPNAIKYKDNQYDENIYYSFQKKNGQWTKAKPIPVIDTTYNEASCSFNPINDIIIVYKDNDNGSLYWSKLINNHWTILHKFPRPINTSAAENHGTITSDGKTLYFSSDRYGSYGQKDIWMSHLLPNGSWSKPINLGPNINTGADEDAPYITPDGKYLYFSSTGHNSMGGYDIFVSQKDEFGAWGPAKNLGYPINSVYDDIFFFPVDSATAYFASNRPGGLGHTDIYVVKFLPTKKYQNFAVAVIKGFNKTQNLSVKISNYITGQTIITKPNQIGNFVFLNQPSHKYKITIQNSQGRTLYQNILFSTNVSKLKLEHQPNLPRN